MIATLPMYDFPWTASANDALWAAMRDRLRADGIAAPQGLTRGADLAEIWRSPELLFGQTCGYPYWRELRDFVEILATPRYAFAGCEGADHCSFIVVRRDDPRAALAEFRGARAAVNARDSNTGMNLFRATVAPFAGYGRFFASVSVTGAHVASLRAVAQDEADIAAVDCVTFGLVARGRPDAAAGIRVLARTPAAPCLPFIASLRAPEAVRARIRAVLTDLVAAPGLAEARATLGIVGIEVLPRNAYARIDELERGAVALGYPALA
jgi:ABC-type phosphate/phosphonate transport system substrate-binding protein